MRRRITLSHEFVNSFPEKLEKGIIYISIKYASVAHKCCCGCGNDVITPLSPTGWSLIFNGYTVSLNPSIGNWNSPCQSHYWIKNNSVVWAPRWPGKENDLGQTSKNFKKLKSWFG